MSNFVSQCATGLRIAIIAVVAVTATASAASAAIDCSKVNDPDRRWARKFNDGPFVGRVGQELYDCDSDVGAPAPECSLLTAMQNLCCINPTPGITEKACLCGIYNANTAAFNAVSISPDNQCRGF